MFYFFYSNCDIVIFHLIFFLKQTFIYSYLSVLPWDQPSDSCKNYKDWCANKILSIDGPWKTMAPVALGLLKGLLSHDPKDRPVLQRVMNHPWMSDHLDVAGESFFQSSEVLKKKFAYNVSELDEDLTRRRFRALIYSVSGTR